MLGLTNSIPYLSIIVLQALLALTAGAISFLIRQTAEERSTSSADVLSSAVRNNVHKLEEQ